MMTCRELTEFLSDYLDGELPERVIRSFDFHLRLCPSCKLFVVQFRETVHACREAGAAPETAPAPLPDDLVRAIMAAVRAPARPDET